MTRSTLLVGVVLALTSAGTAAAQPSAGRGPHCGVFEESHGRVTVVSTGVQFFLPQLTREGRFAGQATFGCWVEIGASDEVRGAFMYGYRLTDPSGESKEFGSYGIEAGGFGSTGTIAVPAYKKPLGAWAVEFYTIGRDTGARASLGTASFTMSGASETATTTTAPPTRLPPATSSGKTSMGSVLGTPSTKPPIASGAPQPKPGDAQTRQASAPATGVLFEDRFDRPDAATPGPRWREYTFRNNVPRLADSPWRVGGGSLTFEATGAGAYVEDLVETVDAFLVDNVRVEFEFNGQAATSKGYVGPTVWWAADAARVSGAGNVSGGPPLIGVQATYRWENRGTRGVTVNVGGVMRDLPDAVFAGLNEPGFRKHAITIAGGRITYESEGLPAVTYPLAVAPAPGERRHLVIGARLFDAGQPQVLHVRNVRISAVGGGATSTAARSQAGGGQLRTGATVTLLTSSVPPSGGTLTIQKPGDPLDGLRVEVPPGAYRGATRFVVSAAAITGQTFGRAVTPASPLITVDNGGGYADEIMRVTVPVSLPDGYFAMGFFYDAGRGRVEGMPLVGISPKAITVATRHFSSFFISMIPLAELDQAIATGTVDTWFRPGLDDWEFPNAGSFIKPGGHCAGQSLTALWYFVTKPDGPDVHLWNRYDRNRASPATPDLWQDDSQAYRFVSVVQRDIRWDSLEYVLMHSLAGVSDRMTMRAFAYAMTVTEEPQKVGIYSKAGGGHAMIAYLIKGGTLYIADPNYPGDNNRRIVFDQAAGRFTPYNSAANAADLAQGRGRTYETIQYDAKTAIIDWTGIKARFDEMRAGRAGDGLFPAYQFSWVDENGNRGPLTDGTAIEQTYIRIDTSVTGAARAGWNVFLNGTRAEKGVNGLYELKPGVNEIGVEVHASADGANFDYVDFKYLRVTSGEAPGQTTAGENPCAGVVEAASAAGMRAVDYYRAERAKPAGASSMAMVLCSCPVAVTDAELAACLGVPADLSPAPATNACAGLTVENMRRGTGSAIKRTSCAMQCPNYQQMSDAALQACMSRPPGR